MKRLWPWLGFAAALSVWACEKTSPLIPDPYFEEDAVPARPWAVGETIQFQVTTAANTSEGDVPFAGIAAFLIELSEETELLVRDLAYTTSCTDGFDEPTLIVTKGSGKMGFPLQPGADSSAPGLLPAGRTKVEFLFTGSRACVFDVKATLFDNAAAAGGDGGSGHGGASGGDGGHGGDGDGASSDDGGSSDGSNGGGGDDDGGSDDGGDDGSPAPGVEAAQLGAWELQRSEGRYSVVGRWAIRDGGAATHKLWAASHLVLDADYLMWADPSTTPARIRMVVTAVRAAFVGEPVEVGQQLLCVYGFGAEGEMLLRCGTYQDGNWPESLAGASVFKLKDRDPSVFN